VIDAGLRHRAGDDELARTALLQRGEQPCLAEAIGIIFGDGRLSRARRGDLVQFPTLAVGLEQARLGTHRHVLQMEDGRCDIAEMVEQHRDILRRLFHGGQLQPATGEIFVLDIDEQQNPGHSYLP
jgi:hypothetical protein